jgi:hypothetical protein
MMKTIFAAALLVAATIPVSAQQVLPPQQQPQKFVPFTVTEKDADNVKAFLQDVPFKFSAPIFQWMAQLEAEAVSRAAAESKDQPAVDASKPVTPAVPPAADGVPVPRRSPPSSK